MASVTIRNIDDQTMARLKDRAARNGQSLQAELRQILERAALSDAIDARASAAEIRRKLSGRQHSNSALLISRDRRR
jgi:antitoxin FitA